MSVATASQIDCYVNRASFLDAMLAVSDACPARSPRPILQGVKFVASEGGCELIATNLELGVRRAVLGVEVGGAGETLLPRDRVLNILKASSDEHLAIKQDGDSLLIRGARSRFKLSTDDPGLFPTAPEFDANAYVALGAGDLKRAIRRVVGACDTVASRLALEGCLVDLSDDELSLVATDGHRLHRQAIPREAEGDAAAMFARGQAVVPAKAMQYLDKILDESDPPVHFAYDRSWAYFRTDLAVIAARLIEGQFPQYRRIFPPGFARQIPIPVAGLAAACRQASAVVVEESRGAEFAFGGGRLRVSKRTQDVGESEAEVEIPHDGDELTVTCDLSYVADVLRPLERDKVESVEVCLVSDKAPVVFRAGDDFIGVVMPMARD